MGLLMTADEIAEELNINRSDACQIIKQLNVELKQDNYITIEDKIPRKLFEKRFYSESENKKRDKKKKITIRSIKINIEKEFDDGIVFEYDEGIGKEEAEEKLFEFCRNLIEKNIAGWYVGG